MATNNFIVDQSHNKARIRLYGDLSVTLSNNLSASFSIVFFTTTNETFNIQTAQAIVGLNGADTTTISIGGRPGVSIELFYDLVGHKWYIVNNNMIGLGIARTSYLVTSYPWENGDNLSVSLISSKSTVTSSSPIVLTATPSISSGIQKVEFYKNDTLFATDTNAPYTTNASFAWTDNGSVSYTAKVYDSRNHTAISEPVVVTINIPEPDTTAPVVSLSSDTTSVTANSTINLTATATDNVGISKVEFLRNGVVFATKTTAPFTANQAVSFANNGTVQYTAKAYDAANNSTLSSTVNVVINIAPPDSVEHLTLDPVVVTSTQAAIDDTDSGEDKTQKRRAAAQAIIDEMAPAHKMNIYRNNVTIFSVQFDSIMSLYDDGTDIGISLGDVTSGTALQSADINTGTWTFEVMGGPQYQRTISGTVGPVGSGANIILGSSPFLGQEFDALITFIFDRSVDD